MKHFKCCVVLFLMWLVLGTLGGAAPTATRPRYDVLIVIDGSKPAQVQEEHTLRVQLEKSRVLQNLDERDLPVDTYDVNNAGQKVAVERLKIPAWQLPFLGLAVLGGDQNVPQRVEFGGGPVDKIEEAVASTMKAAFSKLGVAVKLPSTASTPPTSAGTASPGPSPSSSAIYPKNMVVAIIEGYANQAGFMNRLHGDIVEERRRQDIHLPILWMHWVRSGRLLQKMGIAQVDTPVVAVVSLINGQPARILFRLANVANPAQAAHDAVAHAGLLAHPH